MAMESHVPQKRKKTKRKKAVARAAATSHRLKKSQKAERLALGLLFLALLLVII